jgi:hypothetical protein
MANYFRGRMQLTKFLDTPLIMANYFRGHMQLNKFLGTPLMATLTDTRS